MGISIEILGFGKEREERRRKKKESLTMFNPIKTSMMSEEPSKLISRRASSERI